MTLQDLIANGQIRKALDSLRIADPGNDQIVQVSGRYSSLMERNAMGILDNGEYERSLSKITASILSVGQDIPLPAMRAKDPVYVMGPQGLIDQLNAQGHKAEECDITAIEEFDIVVIDCSKYDEPDFQWVKEAGAYLVLYSHDFVPWLKDNRLQAKAANSPFSLSRVVSEMIDYRERFKVK